MNSSLEPNSNQFNLSKNISLIILLLAILLGSLAIITLILVSYSNNTFVSYPVPETTAMNNQGFNSIDSSPENTEVNTVSSSDNSTTYTSSNPVNNAQVEKVTGSVGPQEAAFVELPTQFSQTAAAGDNLSWLARRAMYDYLGRNGFTLTTEQRLFFEVTLTNSAGAVDIFPGTIVNWDVNILHNVYNQSINLLDQQLSAWNYQVQLSNYI